MKNGRLRFVAALGCTYICFHQTIYCDLKKKKQKQTNNQKEKNENKNENKTLVGKNCAVGPTKLFSMLPISYI